MAYFTDLFTPETWDAFQKHGATVSGFGSCYPPRRDGMAVDSGGGRARREGARKRINMRHPGALHMHIDREFQFIALRLLRHLLRTSGDMGPILSAFTTKH